MTTQKAIDIKKALLLLSDFTGLEVRELAKRICFFDKDLYSKFIEASNEWNKFDNADIIEKGKMLGFEVTIES